jgi:pimeloyl-ACP methyl ester carboxylesterase
MGSFTALAYAMKNPERVSVVCAYLPIVDLRQIVDPQPGQVDPTSAIPGAAALILANHGGSIDSEDNPAENTTLIQSNDIPTRLYRSTNDTVGDPGLAEDFANSCTNVELVDYGAQGHTTTGLDTEGMCDWVLSVI